eukprot:CAMPEP_0171456654 /NCGR_PEP_ID=MMETSP0945-20130129/3049_1 /TAXON_ID=109269 /ORGANISM="Vaucheria litorea, Strain CCMP2940" /LENGTH=447 /DNA_ID=CAMNT_0011982111 /DNA_START=35 /DNA_END=1378 /DNA_ORIENTATION=-
MTRTLFLLALGVTFVAAAVSDCTYDAVASQADDQDVDYMYCSMETQMITDDGQNSPAQLTVDVFGSHGECLELAEDLSDQELDDQLGLKTRPRYKGQFSQDTSGDITFTLDQFGNSDPDCTLVQRHIELDWGEDYCVNAQDPSQGIIHDIYFSDATACDNFAALTAAQRKFQVDNAFPGYADDMIDSWAIAKEFAAALNITLDYTVDDKVLTRSFTQDTEFSRESSLCYGVGDAYAPPFLIPVLTNDTADEYYVENHVHALNDGYVCGYDCFADTQAAYQRFGALVMGGTPLQVATVTAIAEFAQSTCGILYGINGTGGDPSYGGLPSQRAFILALTILGVGEVSTCDVCRPAQALSGAMSPFDLFGRLTTISQGDIPDSDAAAKYTFCQPGAVMSSILYLKRNSGSNNDFTMTDIDACEAEEGTTSSASAISIAFALVASLFVAMH